MITVSAPAKLNLTLEVLSRREDGYHEIRSVVQTIGLYDELIFNEATEIRLISPSLDIMPGENLVLKAAKILQKVSGEKRGTIITLKKAIPISGGLGGGSSDAAFTLIALNELWQLQLPRHKLAELAAVLGSDVPFFIYGGLSLLEGRGENVKLLEAKHSSWVVLIHPHIPAIENKTQNLYKNLREKDFTDGRYTNEMVQNLTKEGRITDQLLFNVFESVAFSFFPDLNKHKQKMADAGASKVSLAGSGPVLYSLFYEERPARKAYDQLSQGGNRVYCVKTLS